MLDTVGKEPSTSSVCCVSREQRRALKKLAGPPRPYLLMAHGYSAEMLSALVRAKFATVVTSEPRGVTLMVERIRITDAGQMSLEG